MDSRHQQRSIALSHIPPLPISHGLEYPLGSRMYLVVVHPRPEAGGRPFPHSPRSRSRTNLRVLRPLTQGPQGQPSSLRTPHGHPGVQGIFLTSRGQVPCGWPMVPHSMVTVSPLPRGCCSLLSALFPLFLFVRNPAPPLSPFPLPVTGTVPTPHPSSRIYTPLGHQQPFGAGPLDPHPSGDRFVRLARVAPIPPPCACFVCFFCGRLCGPCHTVSPAPSPHPILLFVPIPLRAACISCVYLTRPHATLWRVPKGPFLAPCTGYSHRYYRCLLARCCVLSGCVFKSFFWGGSFFCAHPVGRLPPHFPLRICALSRGFLLLLFFSLLPACTHVTTALDISCCGSPVFSSLVLSPPRGVPLGTPRPSQVGTPPSRQPLSSPLLALPPSPASRPFPLLLLSCPVCSALLLSAPGLNLARPHAFLCLCSVLRPVGRLGRPPQVPIRGDSPVARPRRPPLHQFPDGGAGRPVRLNAGHWHGVDLWAMWCSCLPLFARRAPPSARGLVVRPGPPLPLFASRARLVPAHARPACAPCPLLQYRCPAALTPLSLPLSSSSTHHLTVSQPCVTQRGFACP